VWLFTKYGFYTFVCAEQGDGGKHGRSIDLGRIMVRCRLRQHLEALQARFPDLAGCEIMESLHADYAYRIFVDEPVWSQVLAGLNEEMDYDNFKSEVARHQGPKGAAYERALHEVWSVIYRLQQGG
jgi:hypothetical protein